MKKLLIAAVAVCVLLSGCAGNARIDGHVIPAVGIANPEARVSGVQYEISMGSVIVATIFSETIIIPVLIVGWDLYQPVA
jgi:hypothetical protein